MLSILAAPFFACLILGAVHCYMGMHIIRRGVIFVDLALAQMAALGGTVALLVGPMIASHHVTHRHGNEAEAAAMAPAVPGETASDVAKAEGHDDEDTALSYGLSLAFSFFGAALFAVTRLRDNRVPHEAIIGICYVVSAAAAMLILNKTPHGSEKAEEMLVGNILFVGWGEVWKTAVLYTLLVVPHMIWGKKILRISENVEKAEAEGLNVRLWDFVFYAIFGVMVTHSVRIAGVLLVFSFLIIPAVCAAMLFTGFRRCLFFGWTVSLVASIAGLWFSANADMPTGSSLVVAFGAALVVCAAASRFVRPRGSEA